MEGFRSRKYLDGRPPPEGKGICKCRKLDPKKRPLNIKKDGIHYSKVVYSTNVGSVFQEPLFLVTVPREEAEGKSPPSCKYLAQ